MKKLLAITLGIVIILSITLVMPAMADKPATPGKPVVSAPHYDVNLITGQVDTLAIPIYQIKVSASGVSTINVVADTAFGITDWDATVGNGTVTVPSGATYTVYAQFRSSGKPSASANLTLVGVDTWQFPTGTKNEWVLISDSVGAGDTIILANNKCSNFATRWFLNESEEPVVLFEEHFTGLATSAIPAGWNETAAHPNWGATITAYAAGSSPEMMFSWSPSFVGTSMLISPEIDASAYSDIELTFRHYVNHFGGPYTLKVQVSDDGGATWVDAWTIINPTGDVGPATVTVDLSAYYGKSFKIAWVFAGASYNIWYWYIDDILVTGS